MEDDGGGEVPVSLSYGSLEPAEKPASGPTRRWYACVAVLFLAAVAMLASAGHWQQWAVEVSGPQRTVMSVRKGPVSGWVVERRARPDEKLKLTFMLSPRDPKKLEEHALAVSDPSHKLYGQHWDLTRLAREAAPKAAALAAVEQWLRQHTGRGLEQATRNAPSNIVSVPVSVAEAERLLHAEYYLYARPPSRGQTKRVVAMRTMKYSLPAALVGYIDWIGPTTSFPALRSVSSTRIAAAESAPFDASSAAATSSIGSIVTPDTVHTYVQIPQDAQCAAGSKSKVGVAAFLGEKYNPDDLINFLAANAVSVLSERPIQKCDGDCEGSGLETSMDLEYVMAIAKKCTTEFWYQSGRSPQNEHNEPFLAFFERVTSDSDAPSVFSISYSDWEPGVDEKYARAVNSALMSLASTGISVIAASGDAGVEGAQPLPHSAWPGHVCNSADRFIPTFPSSSPWVTSVGATTSQSDPVAASLSGGGFSNYFPTPAWQQDAVAAWLTGAKTQSDLWGQINGKFNENGRGYPDLALQGMNVKIFANGSPMVSGGTSASTPMVAAIVALLNDKRLSNGDSPLGFLNPLLYKNPGALRDVTFGNNPGCGTDGFSAGTSWDPVTGLGEPRYDRLLNLI